MDDMLRTIKDFAKFQPKHKLTDNEITLVAGLLTIDNGQAMNIISTCFDEKFCVELKKYIEICEKLPNLDDILAGIYPENDRTLSTMYAITSGLTFELITLYDNKDGSFYEKMDCWIEYIQTLPHEFAVSGLHDIMARCNDIDLGRLKKWPAFAKKYTAFSIF